MLIQLLIIQVVTFTALVFALRALFARQFNTSLRRLRDLQEEALTKESQINDELARAKRERLAEIDKGKLEARALILQAKKEVELLRLKAGDQASEESHKIINSGKDEVQKLRREFSGRMEEEALYYAVEIVQGIFSDKGMQVLHRQLIDEIIADIGSLSRDSFSVKSSRIVIISSVALDGAEKERLEKLLSEKIGSAVSIEEKMDPDIVAGLIVRIGELVIDGSIKNKLAKAFALLKQPS